MGIRRNLWVSNMHTETLATSDHALVRGDAPGEPLADHVPVAAKRIGISRAMAYIEIQAGRLESFTVGTRRNVTRRAQWQYVLDREAEERAKRKAKKGRETDETQELTA